MGAEERRGLLRSMGTTDGAKRVRLDGCSVSAISLAAGVAAVPSSLVLTRLCISPVGEYDSSICVDKMESSTITCGWNSSGITWTEGTLFDTGSIWSCVPCTSEGGR